MAKMVITVYLNQELRYEDAKRYIAQIIKDYPKAKIRIIFR